MGKQRDFSLYAMNDFRTYVWQWVQSRGRGEFGRIAKYLSIHTTLVSQIFNGHKCLTEEQAAKLCDYMGLSATETDYFIKLVLIERAGSEQLKTIYRRQLKQLQSQATEIKSRVPISKELTTQDRAIFYSSWLYSFVRLLTSIDRFQSVQEISAYLGIPLSRTQEILEFLTSRGLCELHEGKYRRTDKNTHIEAQSPLVVRHHQNWRGKSLSLHEKMSLEDLAFTSPLTISKADIPKVRSILLEAISEIAKVVEKSPSEEVVYLGIDWIRM